MLKYCFNNLFGSHALTPSFRLRVLVVFLQEVDDSLESLHLVVDEGSLFLLKIPAIRYGFLVVLDDLGQFFHIHLVVVDQPVGGLGELAQVLV